MIRRYDGKGSRREGPLAGFPAGNERLSSYGATGPEAGGPKAMGPAPTGAAPRSMTYDAPPYNAAPYNAAPYNAAPYNVAPLGDSGATTGYALRADQRPGVTYAHRGLAADPAEDGSSYSDRLDIARMFGARSEDGSSSQEMYREYAYESAPRRVHEAGSYRKSGAISGQMVTLFLGAFTASTLLFFAGFLAAVLVFGEPGGGDSIAIRTIFPDNRGAITAAAGSPTRAQPDVNLHVAVPSPVGGVAGLDTSREADSAQASAMPSKSSDAATGILPGPSSSSGSSAPAPAPVSAPAPMPVIDSAPIEAEATIANAQPSSAAFTAQVPASQASGFPDSGFPDSGPPNSGPPNSGPPNSGPPNSGPPNSGPAEPSQVSELISEYVLGNSLVTRQVIYPAAKPPMPPRPTTVVASAPQAVASAPQVNAVTVKIGPPGGAYSLQFGAFRDRDNAEDLLRELGPRVQARIVEAVGAGGLRLFYVRAGAFDSRSAAVAVVRDLRRALGIVTFVYANRVTG